MRYNVGMDEAYLIETAQQGNLDSFNSLVLVYQDYVYNQAYRIMGEEAAASDAVQEAFVSAYLNIRSFRGGSFRAWLFRIVTNACYDEMRQRKRKPSTSLEPLDDSGEEVESPQWLADPNDGPEDEMERRQLAKAIQHCLEDLPPEYRSVAILVDVQGMDYDEAAQVIHKPLGTVKSRLARARLRLRECLQGFGELLPVVFRLESEGSL